MFKILQNTAIWDKFKLGAAFCILYAQVLFPEKIYTSYVLFDINCEGPFSHNRGMLFFPKFEQARENY